MAIAKRWESDDGDRFWYPRVFSGRQLAELEQTTLADIIQRNTTVRNLQDNVFFLRAEVRGTVFFDRNGDGDQDRGESGIAGVLVELLNDEGEVIARARTNSQGSYRFDAFRETGDFQVRVVVPSRLTVTTENPQEFVIPTGDVTVRGKDFGLRLADRGMAGRFFEEFADILTALTTADDPG
ncbi:MAG: hypothetical protein L0Z62_18185 [Gemmataceae bacterium]|nr:hypothetical protein [Gemmataceae bacterium]